MLNKIARVTSWVLHPFLIPIYIMVILLFTGTVHSYYSWKVKTYLLWNVTLYSLILPTLALALIKRLRRLSSGTKRISRKEITIIALLVGGACFVTLAITMMKYPALAIFRKMALAGLFCEIFCLVALPFSRISYHLTAMGAAVALFTMLNILGEISLFWTLIVTILLAGVLSSVRLYMGRNRSRQLLYGFVGGFLLCVAAMMWC